MSWFERHLNWSFVLAIWIIPTIIFMILYAVFFAAIYGAIQSLKASGAGEEAIVPMIMTSVGLPFFGISILISLGLLVFDILATMWYLGQKARSRWWTLVLFAPAGLIILLCLENQSIGAVGDYGLGLPSDRLSHGGGYGSYGGQQYSNQPYTGVYDERLTKDLDYTPTQNVLDISGADGTPGSIYTSEVVKEEKPAVKAEASPISEPPDNVTRAISQEKSTLPILLDDSGAAIKCGYHPENDAVNRCSRCSQYVCADCNYITGTHPICRNCWEKRTIAPLAPSTGKVEKQKPQKAAKPEKGKAPEQQPQAAEAVEVTTAEPPVMAATVEPEKPAGVELPPSPTPAEMSELQMPTRPLEPQVPAQALEPQITMRPVEPNVPPEPVEPATPSSLKKEEVVAAVEQPKVIINEKAAKQEAEKILWQQEFMALYQQAAPIVNVIVRRDAEGMPASPLDLMEGLKLRPMLERVKKLSKPKDKDMREAKSELENLLSSCIKIADAAANFISSGGQALLGGPDFKKIVSGIETASGLLEKLSGRIPQFARPQE